MYSITELTEKIEAIDNCIEGLEAEVNDTSRVAINNHGFILSDADLHDFLSAQRDKLVHQIREAEKLQA